MQIKHSFLIKYKLFYCAYFLLLVPRIYMRERATEWKTHGARDVCCVSFFGVNLAIWRLLNFLYRAREQQQQRLKALKYVNMPGNISCAHIQKKNLVCLTVLVCCRKLKFYWSIYVWPWRVRFDCCSSIIERSCS